MQDRYAGDIGDFGKFALLKALSSAGFKIGVNWYRTCPQSFEKQDDVKISYSAKVFFLRPAFGGNAVYNFSSAHSKTNDLQAARGRPGGCRLVF